MSINDIISRYNTTEEVTKEDKLKTLSNVIADLMGKVNNFLNHRADDFKFSDKEITEIADEIIASYKVECEKLDLMTLCAEACDTYMHRSLHPHARTIIQVVQRTMRVYELNALKAEIKNNPHMSALCAYYAIENLEAKYRRYF